MKAQDLMDSEIVRTSVSDLRTVSKDKANKITLVDSDVKAVNFDRVAKKWADRENCRHKPMSADALIVHDDDICIVEFKNTDCERIKAELKFKFYHSMIVLADIYG